MSTIGLVAETLAVGLLVLCASTVSGQNYPNKPIRIVTQLPGGGSDLVARLIAQGISGAIGQPVIIDNRGGMLSNEVVSKALPDGYSVLFSGQSLWIVPLLQAVPYDMRDFSPVVLTTTSPYALALHPAVAAKSVKELIALSKASPGALNYASGPAGSSNHLAAELFKSMAGVNIVRIAYKGSGPALNELLGGQVQLMFPNAGAATPHMKSGKLKVLAVTSAQPTMLLPGVPTIAASGLPGFLVATPEGVFAPAQTPASIIGRLNQEIVRFLNTAEAKQRFLDMGAEVGGGTPGEFAATVKSETAVWSKIIKDAGIRAD